MARPPLEDDGGSVTSDSTILEVKISARVFLKEIFHLRWIIFFAHCVGWFGWDELSIS